MSKVTHLPLSQLQPNPFQPREKIKKQSIDELVDSIKQFGVLEPLVVAETPAGYQIIAGERRWRAAIAAGINEVPVHLKKTTPKGMLEMALVENVQRTDLNPLERAQAFRQLMRDFSLTLQDVSERISKSESYISNSLRLLELPDAVKDGLVGGLITEGHARALNGLIADEAGLIKCYKTILKESASVRRAEELVRHYKQANQLPGAHKGKALKIPDEFIEQVQRKLELQYHTRPVVKLSRSTRQTKIAITLKGSPEETEEDLQRMIDNLVTLDKVQ